VGSGTRPRGCLVSSKKTLPIPSVKRFNSPPRGPRPSNWSSRRRVAAGHGKTGWGCGSRWADAPSPPAAAGSGCCRRCRVTRSGDSGGWRPPFPCGRRARGNPLWRFGRVAPSRRRVAAVAGKRDWLASPCARGCGDCHMKCGSRRALITCSNFA
jgi:hypothetical protein